MLVLLQDFWFCNWGTYKSASERCKLWDTCSQIRPAGNEAKTNKFPRLGVAGAVWGKQRLTLQAALWSPFIIQAEERNTPFSPRWGWKPTLSQPEKWPVFLIPFFFFFFHFVIEGLKQTVPSALTQGTGAVAGQSEGEIKAFNTRGAELCLDRGWDFFYFFFPN